VCFTIRLQGKKQNSFRSKLPKAQQVSGLFLTDMNEENDFNPTTSCEGSQELNGKDVSYRSAPMISAPPIVQKRRIRGALVPMPIQE